MPNIMWRPAIKCHMKVGDTIVSSKTAKYTGKPPSPATMILKVKAFVFHSYLSFSFKKWITLSTRWGM
ncbi:hypothetical protein EMCRGX_G015470 [Ephydatia muelleri]